MPVMNQGRYSATATLLPTGKVLIAGGCCAGSPGSLSSTEFYDPTTNTFAVGPPMNAYRENATATLLQSGKVLIAGPDASTDIYDPACSCFLIGPRMNEARPSAVATLLPNGNVLIAGGYNPGQSAAMDIYDPATNTFVTGPNMNVARGDAAAVLLPNGKFLIAGGCCDPGVGTLASTELYDPAANTFASPSSTATMNVAQEGATATLLTNGPDSGKVLISGGDTHDNPLLSTELYDPVTNSFASTTPTLSVPRRGSTATLLH
jgi:Galactose oxidase, central domain